MLVLQKVKVFSSTLSTFVRKAHAARRYKKRLFHWEDGRGPETHSCWLVSGNLRCLESSQKSPAHP